MQCTPDDQKQSFNGKAFSNTILIVILVGLLLFGTTNIKTPEVLLETEV